MCTQSVALFVFYLATLLPYFYCNPASKHISLEPGVGVRLAYILPLPKSSYLRDYTWYVVVVTKRVYSIFVPFHYFLFILLCCCHIFLVILLQTHLFRAEDRDKVCMHPTPPQTPLAELHQVCRCCCH